VLNDSSSTATSQVELKTTLLELFTTLKGMFESHAHTDERIPTVSLGVPNAESGHCLKTLAIIDHLDEWIASTSAAGLDTSPGWYVIADDDSIIG
jgi:hypothetical protein